ncbi:MAG: hypothetical protein HY661_00655 [Betaproteobacteria bacterium]|nr:hypothetical protein [Betaproteobacteria bacterium]
MAGSKNYWLDRRENVSKVYGALWVLCAVLLLIDPLIDKHEAYEFAEWLGFFGFFGFFSCVGLVLTAKALRRLLKRPENYYDER